MSIRARKLWILPLLLAALWMIGCDQKTIAEVKADPARYHNRDVGIVGQVTESYSVMNYGVYELSDHTGKIYVVTTRGGSPAKGSKVAVRGNTWNGFNLSLPGLEKFGKYGMVIREKDLKIKDYR